MNHTKGKIETFKKTNGSIQIDYNGAYIGSLRPPPSSGWFKEDEIDTEKIANLIAAAPELFKALKAMTKLFEERVPYPNNTQRYKQAIKAIAKAEGE